MTRVLRKRFSNGLIVGFRTREWWIGARRDFPSDSVWIGLFGLMLIIPNEFWWNRRNR